MHIRICTLPLLIALTGCVDASPDIDDMAEPGTAADAQPSPTTLTMAGLGAVRIGMTPPAAEAALGTELSPMTVGEEAACWQTRRADGEDPQVFYMVENGKITRIDIEDTTGDTPTAIKTDKGIGIGADEADVMAAYGPTTKVMPHKYDEHGHYLVVESPDGGSALLFETSNGKITTFRAGVHPSVDYVEGCS
jgi:hypothetical protein